MQQAVSETQVKNEAQMAKDAIDEILKEKERLERKVKKLEAFGQSVRHYLGLRSDLQFTDDQVLEKLREMSRSEVLVKALDEVIDHIGNRLLRMGSPFLR